MMVKGERHSQSIVLERRRGRRIIGLAVVMVVILSALTVLTRHTPREKKMSAGPMLGAVAAAANPEMQLAWEGEAETTLFTVCIDPGHGGNDCGSVSGDRWESKDDLVMGLAVKDALERRNINVVMTRTEDEYVYLKERAEIANQAEAQYFLSIHRNMNYAGCGVETWTASECDEETLSLAESVQRGLAKVGVQRDRGVKHGTHESAASDYYVLRNTDMPAVLIELGFLDNRKDNELLDKNRKAYAEAIAQAIQDTFEQYHE